MVGATLASFVVLAAGHVPPRRGRRSRRSSGWSPPRCCCTRFDFPFLAARGYIDIPYLAFVVWAAALEAERPRRGTPVLPAARLRRADAPGGVAARGPVLAVVIGWPATWPQRVTLRRARRRAGPVDLDRDRLVGDRRPAVLADPHERPRRGARAHQQRARRRCPAATREVPQEPRQGAGLLRGDRSGFVLAVLAHAAARAHAARAAGHRPGHVRARRRRRAVGHRPLPAGAVADGHDLRRRRARRLDDAALGRARARPGRSGRSLLVVYGVVFTATRVNLRRFTNELTLPRRLARVAACAARRPEGPRGAALRPGVDAQPQADPRRALGPRRARPARCIARSDPTSSARGSGAAWRLHGQPHRAPAPGLHRRRRVDARTPSNSIPHGGLHAARDDAVLQRLCPLLSRRS